MVRSECAPWPEYAFSFAALLAAHFKGDFDVRRIDDGLPPRSIRLGRWITVEMVCVGSDVYCLLRRIAKPARPAMGIAALTVRQLEAARLVSRGVSNKEIAYAMSISHSTVGVLLWHACRKLGVTNRTELSRIFIEDDV
jgi:DNA-binding CsgD family transcriptional regulator